jgi:hypothetical protein
VFREVLLLGRGSLEPRDDQGGRQEAKCKMDSSGGFKNKEIVYGKDTVGNTCEEQHGDRDTSNV